MAIGALEPGLIARYRGGSSQAARLWFFRLWRRIRAVQGLSEPSWPRTWPFQEAELAPTRACSSSHHRGTLSSANSVLANTKPAASLTSFDDASAINNTEIAVGPPPATPTHRAPAAAGL